jgi:hypothetical protein
VTTPSQAITLTRQEEPDPAARNGKSAKRAGVSPVVHGRELQSEVATVSIVRVGLAETKGFDEGYEAIFGKKKAETKKPESTAKASKPKGKKKAKKK